VASDNESNRVRAFWDNNLFRYSCDGSRCEIYPFFTAKQLELLPNLVVCYTSTNLYATVAALNEFKEIRKVTGKVKDLQQFGNSLRNYHTRYGGIAEVLAVIWRRPNFEPHVLEVMPIQYLPKQRCGGVDIGDKQTLQRFLQIFQRELSFALSNLSPPKMAPEVLEAWAKRLGDADPFRRPLTLRNAATLIVGSLSDAIKEANSPTVGLPLQGTLITHVGIIPIGASQRHLDSGTWKRLTFEMKELTLPSNKPSPTKFPQYECTAMQLFY
jgi:hypothetical protein